MTQTLLSLISVAVGIVGANLTGRIFKKHSLGLIGNTLAGVFGSAFLTKSFGRLGFGPDFIVEHNSINYGLFTLNVLVSFFGGAVALFIITKVKDKMNSKKQ